MKPFAFGDEQIAFAATVRRVLATESTPEQLRRLWDSELGRNPALWKALAEVGLPAMLLSESVGGGGATIGDVCLALEEVGAASTPDALVQACVVGPTLLEMSAGAVDDGTRELVAAGELRLGVTGADRVVAQDAHVSDIVLLRRGAAIFVLGRADRVDTPLASADQSRRPFEVRPRPGAEPVCFELTPKQLSVVTAREQLSNAAVLVGLSRAMLDRTVAYVKLRTQFDQTIGSFQAVKHMLAEVASRVALAQIAVWTTAIEMSTDDLSIEDAARAARRARICAGEAEREVNHVALQLHGGIGFTWESDLQIWLKRGKVLEQEDGGHLALLGAEGLDQVERAGKAVRVAES